ncbi:hypothetical protein CCAN11_2280031 [Capnocytophaga canimorsus]|uniref:Uncharacterized protein n=1 Tax=Capnocytophaga canimorsus TaxID=28188 RepID=A0A0B7IMR6_9FLAO|nr:hypothetical protein CCAN11_2280031 [Capnocytophaga canimorsus]
MPIITNNTLIPIDLVNKIKEAATFMEGMQTIRQLSFRFIRLWLGILILQMK